jgi:hypothetical protein
MSPLPQRLEEPCDSDEGPACPDLREVAAQFTELTEAILQRLG